MRVPVRLCSSKSLPKGHRRLPFGSRSIATSSSVVCGVFKDVLWSTVFVVAHARTCRTQIFLSMAISKALVNFTSLKRRVVLSPPRYWTFLCALTLINSATTTKSSENRENKTPPLMEKCDTCLLYQFDKGWCRQNKHCRISGHQYTPSTIESIQQLTKGDQSSYTLFSNCPKCPRPPQTQPYSSSFHHAPPVSQPFGNQPPLTHTSHGQPNQLYDPYRHPPSQPQQQRPPSRSPSNNADSRYQQPR